MGEGAEASMGGTMPLSIVVVAVVVVVVLGLMVRTVAGGGMPPTLRVVAWIAGAGAVALGAVHAIAVVRPAAPIVAATLTTAAPTVLVPKDGGPHLLRVSGSLPPLQPGASVRATYAIAVERADAEPVVVADALEETWGKAKVGRRRLPSVPVAVARLEHDAPLPSLAGGATLRLQKLEGAASAVDVAVVPEPVGQGAAALAFAVLLVAAAVCDAKAKLGAGSAAAVGAIGAFALLLHAGPLQPSLGAVVALAAFGTLGGATLGAGARALARRVLAPAAG
jgi:hypothetical protein